jgi:hypothetical protein
LIANKSKKKIGVTLNKSIQLLRDLIALCPEFSETWASEVCLWRDNQGNFGPCGVFATFSRYVAHKLMANERDNLMRIFEFAESCMSDDDEVSTAVATCFLENLMNRTPEEIDPATFVPLLGPKSRDYCQGWDEFCGVKTKGLW